MKSLSFLLTLFVSIYGVLASNQNFGLYENGGAQLPMDLYVLNEDSVPVMLTDLIDKPTLLVFTYYTCNGLCPKLYDGIAELVNYSEATPGTDYQILTLSIDPAESSNNAQAKKLEYNRAIKKPITPYFWRFLTTDSTTIKTLTQLTGWQYRKTNSDIIHTTATVLLTPNGVISQYFYGTYFNYMHFDMSVQQAAREEVVPTRLKNLKYCTSTISKKNSYISSVTTVFGILVLGFALVLFVTLKRTERKGE